jgi:uncharacterized protein YkwD
MPDRIAELREESLNLVNAARREENLQPVSRDAQADEAAAAHARDMLERGYYDHVSPEGETVRDRYLAAGGNDSHVVLENLSFCEGCPPPADEEAIARIHEGWMESPEHRENILAEGIASYGFAVVEDGGLRYGVQVFSGPGMPAVPATEEELQPIGVEEQLRFAASLLNELREEEGVAALQPDDELASAAEQLAAEFEADRGGRQLDLEQALPETTAWRRFQAIATSCSGCGTQPTHADIRHFVDMWRDDAGYVAIMLDPDLSAFGFAIVADGDGHKAAIALFAG